jgi:hypothetical protein
MRLTRKNVALFAFPSGLRNFAVVLGVHTLPLWTLRAAALLRPPPRQSAGADAGRQVKTKSQKHEGG